MGTPGSELRTRAVSARPRLMTLLSLTKPISSVLLRSVRSSAPGRLGIFDAVPDSSYFLKSRESPPFYQALAFHRNAAIDLNWRPARDQIGCDPAASVQRLFQFRRSV